MPRASLMATLALLLIVACESGTGPEVPAAGAAPAGVGPGFAAVPNPSFQPFAFTVENCVEPVEVSGTFHAVQQFFVGPGGKEHFRFHLNAKGTGVGQLTGARYQWNDRLFDITNIAPTGAVSFILNDFTRLIGQGRAVDTRFAIRIKVTINADGETIVDRVVTRSTCG